LYEHPSVGHAEVRFSDDSRPGSASFSLSLRFDGRALIEVNVPPANCNFSSELSAPVFGLRGEVCTPPPRPPPLIKIPTVFFQGEFSLAYFSNEGFSHECLIV